MTQSMSAGISAELSKGTRALAAQPPSYRAVQKPVARGLGTTLFPAKFTLLRSAELCDTNTGTWTASTDPTMSTCQHTAQRLSLETGTVKRRCLTGWSHLSRRLTVCLLMKHVAGQPIIEVPSK